MIDFYQKLIDTNLGQSAIEYKGALIFKLHCYKMFALTNKYFLKIFKPYSGNRKMCKISKPQASLNFFMEKKKFHLISVEEIKNSIAASVSSGLHKSCQCLPLL